MPPSDASPDSKCPICLDRFENVSYLNYCWHRFCFRCIQKWSKNKSKCPLCKQPFHSIVHSIRSENDYKVYTVKPAETDAFVGTDRVPWDDETPGPSYSSSDQVYATRYTTLDTSETSDEELSTNAAVLPTQLLPSMERNEDSCDSLENCVIAGYVKSLDERTPELVELSSDSEESVVDGWKCEEDQKTVKPIQYQSFSETDASGYASPFSLGSRDGSASRKVMVSSSSKNQNHKRSEHDNNKASGSTCLQNSPREREDDYDDSYAFTKKRKSEVYAPQLDREHRSFKSKNKDNSLEKWKKRDSSRHRHRKNKKKSKAQHKSLSQKSKVLSLSNESIYSRELSRSRSRSNDCSKNARRQDSDDYFRGQYHSKYDRNASRDYYELSYSRRKQYPRHSPSPDYGVRSFYERTNNQISRGRSRSYYYGRDRSRSQSSSQSRTPSRGSDRMRSEKPSGKRKYKTRHLESMPRGSEEAASASSKKESSMSENLVPKHWEPYKRSAGLLNSQSEADIPRKKEKKTSRSPSVEIIYEGTATDITRHQKRKRKWDRKPHTNQVGYSPISSPVVITIDSDSDKASEIQDNTECDSIIFWSPLDPFPPNEKETESPSLLLEARDDKDNKAGEAENVKEHSVIPKGDDVGDEILSGFEPLNGGEELQDPNGRHAPSMADNSKASPELSNGETESFCCSPTHKSLSRKSKVLSLSNESIYSQELSRSISRSNKCSKNSRRQESDGYFRGQYYSTYDRNASGDYYELSYSRQNNYSRHSPSPNYGVCSFYEQTNNQISRGRSRSYYYGRDRSRSRSSSRTRTPSRESDRTRSEKPSGKRKYKTRHLESMPRGSEEAASSKKESHVFENLVPKHQEPYKMSAGLLNCQSESDIPRKKEKKMSRSPNVEIIYEATVTDTRRHQKKQRKWDRKPRANQMGYSPISSPVVIMIDSDSDKTSEIQDNTECDSSISWSPLDPFPPNEKETESPSLLLEARDDKDNKADEAENVKEHSLTPKRDDVGEETLSGVEPLNGVEELQDPDGRHAPSAADNSKASSEQSNRKTESFCCLPTHKASLLLRLSKYLHEHLCQLDTSEQNL